MADNIYCESSDIERIAKKVYEPRTQTKESFSQSVDRLEKSIKQDKYNISLGE